jgi:hypothetical protein
MNTFVFNKQGDQLGPSFAYVGDCYFGQLFVEDYLSCPDFWASSPHGSSCVPINFEQKWVRASILSNLETKLIWDRCYDHNFLRFLPIFSEKIGVFLKNQCYDHFLCKITFCASQKRRFYSPNFSANKKNHNIDPWSPC